MTKKKTDGVQKDKNEEYDSVVHHNYSSFGSFINDKTKTWPELIQTMDILGDFEGTDKESAQKIAVAKGQIAETMISGMDEISEMLSDIALRGIECRK